MFSTGQLESERSSGRHRRQGAEQRMNEDWNNFNNDDDLEQALRNDEDVSCHENFLLTCLPIICNVCLHKHK